MRVSLFESLSQKSSPRIFLGIKQVVQLVHEFGMFGIGDGVVYKRFWDLWFKTGQPLKTVRE
jgi:hypothetical protein